ncbi:MAG: DUF898 family protein [Acutalibacteraceae bacterium]|nr:DUF898 family protein [Acutalibacteraceae bacterium]
MATKSVSFSILSILIILGLAVAIIGGIIALIVYLANRGKEKTVDTNLDENKSFFDGGYLAYIGYSLLVVFVTSITFGIAFPWMCCLMQRWKAKHTVVCGKRMYFDGTGVQLIGKFILWSFLTIITFGIYGFWMAIAVKKWISKHTHFVGEEDNNSYFDGGILGLIGTNILALIVAVVPFVGFAWSNIIKTKWETKHTVTDSRRLIFTGTVGTFFLKYLLWGFLTSITFGIFGLFIPVKNLRLEAENTIDHEHTVEAQMKQSEYRNIIRTDCSSFKSYNVEFEMEGIKAGITDNMSQEELLAIANGGSRAAQYLYVVRYSEGQYTAEPFSSLLKASAEAEYAPAMCLYALSHDIDEQQKADLFTKSANKGQLPAIRNRMICFANLGLTQNKLDYLKEAVRYGDLLIESGEELSEDEQTAIKKCVLAIRKIESAKSVSSGGGKVVLAVVAVIAVITILLGIVCSLFMFKRAEFPMENMDRPSVEAVY